MHCFSSSTPKYIFWITKSLMTDAGMKIAAVCRNSPSNTWIFLGWWLKGRKKIDCYWQRLTSSLVPTCRKKEVCLLIFLRWPLHEISSMVWNLTLLRDIATTLWLAPLFPTGDETVVEVDTTLCERLFNELLLGLPVSLLDFFPKNPSLSSDNRDMKLSLAFLNIDFFPRDSWWMAGRSKSSRIVYTFWPLSRHT